MKYQSRLAVLGVVLAMLFAGAARAGAQVMNLVPSDAMIVLKVNHLKETSDKMGNLAKEFGLAATVPEAADPLAAMQKRSGINAGVNNKGEMALAVMMPAEDGDKPKVLVLVPVSDYKAFIGNFADAKTEGEITTFTTPRMHQPTYAADWNGYAALSDTQDLLAKKPDGLKVQGAAAAKEMAAKDIVFYANIKTIAAKVLPELKAHRAEALEKAVADFTKQPGMEEYAPVFRAFMNQAMNVAQGYLHDAESATVGFDFGTDGIAVTAMSEFTAGTYSANLVKGLKGAGTDLAGLPDVKYFAFGGMSVDPKTFTQAFNDFMTPISKELANSGPGGKAINDMVESGKKAIAATKSAAFAYAVPAAQGEGYSQQVVVSQGDAKVIQAVQKEQIKTVGELLTSFAKEGEKPPMEFVVQPEAKTVGDLKLDGFEMKLHFDPNDPQAQQTQRMLQMIYGGEGLSGVFGAVNDKVFISATGAPPELLAKTIESAKQGGDTLSAKKHVQGVSDKLPKDRILVEYVALDNIANTALDFAKQQQIPLDVKIPENLPPLGFSIGCEGNALRGDVFLPTETVKDLISAGLTVYGQMQRGQQGGGGL
ncbi:MAG TPA: hypothetical protein VIL86_03575 [Tepidisphaeraceae bacterium]|jgi:hypothetical protein